MKVLFICLGFLSMFIGIAGIVLPGIPTTPFMLLTLTLFLKSSKRLSDWFRNHPFFSKFLNSSRLNRKIILIKALLIMWTMVSVSIIFFVERFSVRLIIVILAVSGTAAMIIAYRKRKAGSGN